MVLGDGSCNWSSPCRQEGHECRGPGTVWASLCGCPWTCWFHLGEWLPLISYLNQLGLWVQVFRFVFWTVGPQRNCLICRATGLQVGIWIFACCRLKAFGNSLRGTFLISLGLTCPDSYCLIVRLARVSHRCSSFCCFSGLVGMRTLSHDGFRVTLTLTAQAQFKKQSLAWGFEFLQLCPFW